MKFQLSIGALSLALAACGGSEFDIETTESAHRSRGPSIERIRFRSLVDGSEIRGSGATLIRRNNQVRIRNAKTRLAPNETVDVFLAIFNNPEECTIGNPVTGVACGPPDLFNAATNGSLHFIETATARANGKLRLPRMKYDAATCAGDPFPCSPLTNPRGAEVHVPLFAPNNGPGVQAAQWQ